MTSPTATVARTAPATLSSSRLRWAWAIGLLGTGTYLLILAIWHRSLLTEVDALIYRFGAEQALHHRPIYHGGLDGKPRLVFNYPPFAALVFLPLTVLPRIAYQVPLAVLAINVGLLVFTVRRCLRAVGVTGQRELAAYTMLAAGALVWLEPVRTHLVLGQVGLLLMALVVADLLPTGKRIARWSGMGIGIAAGIKLTPLLFVGYLLAAKQRRAAVVAGLTFAATVAVGFAIWPGDGEKYWLHGGFTNTHRIAPLWSTGNVSLRGALIRLGCPATGLWLAVTAVVLGLTMVLAVAAQRRGEPVLALALVGMGSCAASPFSWGYHWVWLLPLVIHLASRDGRGWRLVAVAVLVSCGAWITEWRSPLTRQVPPVGIISLHPGGWLEQVTRDWYLLVMMLAMVCAVIHAAGRNADGFRPEALIKARLRRSGSREQGRENR